MANPVPGNISNAEFKKMISGKSRFLPKKVSDRLKSTSFKHLLYKNKISKDQAVKAARVLQEEGVLSEFKPATTLFREAAIRQRDSDEAARVEKIKTNARLIIKQELEEEAAGKSRLKETVNYDSRSQLGKSVYQQLNEEQAARDQGAKDQLAKKEKLDNKNSGPASRPELADLPDMDIG